MSFLCKRLAYLSSDLGDLKAARSYREEAVVIDEKVLTLSGLWGDELGTAVDAHVDLARVCEQLKDWPAAHTHYLRAVEAQAKTRLQPQRRRE